MSYQPEKTKQYTKFRTLGANRDTSRAHISRLKKSIEEHPEILEAQPILINENFEIIDGQHRFLAASELGMPIYYTMVPGIGIETARTLNVLQRAWAPEDYARSYAMTGNKHYQSYLKAREDYGLQHNVTMAALSGGKRNGLNSPFKRGEFEIIDLERGRLWMDRILEIGEAGTIPMTSQFAYSLIAVFPVENFDYARLPDNTKKYGSTFMRRYSSVEDYLRMWEDIYNFGRSASRERLF